MNYVVIEEIYIKVNSEIEDDNDITMYNIGEAYTYDGIVYVFHGDYKESGHEKPGLYVNREDQLIIIDYLEGEELTTDDVVQKKMNKTEDLLNSILKLPKTDATKKRKISSSDEDDEDSKSRRKSDNSKFLKYDIADDDDDVVRLLKETVNEKQIMMQDVYDKSDSDQAGYNLIYGLRQRNSISYSSVEKWATILDMEVKVTLTDTTKK